MTDCSYIFTWSSFIAFSTSLQAIQLLRFHVGYSPLFPLIFLQLLVYSVADIPESAFAAGASGELSSGADLISECRPRLVDGGNVCAVVRGFPGTAQECVT